MESEISHEVGALAGTDTRAVAVVGRGAVHQMEVVEGRFPASQRRSDSYATTPIVTPIDDIIIEAREVNALATGEHVRWVQAWLLDMRELAAGVRARPESHAAMSFVAWVGQRQPDRYSCARATYTTTYTRIHTCQPTGHPEMHGSFPLVCSI